VCWQRNRRDSSRRRFAHRGRCRRNAKGIKAARILRASTERRSPGMDGLELYFFSAVRSADRTGMSGLEIAPGMAAWCDTVDANQDTTAGAAARKL